jgi:hypothetical protein
MQAPSPVPTGKRGRQMNLHDRSANDVPTGAGDLSDVAVFVRDRAGRTENQVVDRCQPEFSLFVDRGLFCHQFFATDNVGCVALRSFIRFWPNRCHQIASPIRSLSHAKRLSSTEVILNFALFRGHSKSLPAALIWR